MQSQAPVITSIGIVGAGQMGNGIAHVCALAGLSVTMMDVKPDALDKAMAVMGRNMDRQVSKGTISAADKDQALARIRRSTDMGVFADCDFVIEAATEKEPIKHAIFKQLCPVLKPSAMLASNTSSISITRLGAGTDRPEKFIGMHFMNPVPVMKLVELIRGIATDEPTFQAVRSLAEQLGKTTAVSEDFPAFIVNRILVPMINEAVYALHEGVGSVTAIDTAMKLGANHPMGPLELADFIGLDTCYSIMQVLYEGMSDTKYRPCPLLAKYVEAGWLGRKSGRGFYDYQQTPPRPTR
ncbi:MAG: 3-hydroxybutyryl-CoA dehydrogenase [Acetobacteraceae bacterium]|nr:3-hydroxybutyryl-CoA dehydrogenase [Acetobacteraceae bacterium]